MPYYGFNTAHGPDQGPPPPATGFSFGVPVQPQYQPQYVMPHAQPWPQPPPMMQPPFVQPSTHYAPPPIGDGGMPGVHVKNWTGGVGVPPDMHYLFPKEHCTLRILRSDEKPWQTTGLQGPMFRLMVPVTMGVKEFMQQIGCNNDDSSKNVLYEIVEKGNGCWTHGLRIPGDDKDKMKKSMGDFGWTAKRTNPIVTLWATPKGG